MTKARTLANFISDGSTLADGAISVSEVSGAAPLASPSFTGNLTVDTDTLYVDAGNNEVGVGTSNPDATMHVYGSLTVGKSGVSEDHDLKMWPATAGRSVMGFRNQDNYMALMSGDPLSTDLFTVTTGGRGSFIGGLTVNENSGAAEDFRVESDSNTHALFVDASADTVHIGASTGSSVLNVSSTGRGSSVIGVNVVNTDSGSGVNTFFNLTNNYDQDFQVKVSEVGAPTRSTYMGPSTNTQLNITGSQVGNLNRDLYLDSGSLVVNQDSRDYDFRVESDSNAHAIFMNAGNGTTAFGTTTNDYDHASNEGIYLSPGSSSSMSANAPVLRLNRNGTGGNNRSNLEFYNNGTLRGFVGSLGVEGGMYFGSGNGAVTNMTLYEDETVVNEDSVDHDFRVESDSNANMFIVDAGLNRVKVGGNAVSTGMVSIQKNVNEDTDTGATPSLVFRNRSLASGSDNIGGGIFFDTFRDIQDPCITAGIWFNKQPTGNVANHADIILGTSTEYGNSTNKPPERLRIISDGNIRVGVGTGNNTVGPVFYGGNLSTGQNGLGLWPEADGSSSVKILSGVNNTAGRIHFRFANPNGTCGQITTSGSGTAYATSSDYRLKTDAQPMTGASARVQALNPVNFEWIADGTRVDGFLAHEAQAIVPEAVTGTKDAVDADGNPEYQGIDQSKLVPLLTAALQEAITKIETLEARITALENA